MKAHEIQITTLRIVKIKEYVVECNGKVKLEGEWCTITDRYGLKVLKTASGEADIETCGYISQVYKELTKHGKNVTFKDLKKITPEKHITGLNLYEINGELGLYDKNFYRHFEYHSVGHVDSDDIIHGVYETLYNNGIYHHYKLPDLPMLDKVMGSRCPGVFYSYLKAYTDNDAEDYKRLHDLFDFSYDD